MALESTLCLDPAMERLTVTDFEDPRIEIYRNLKDRELAGSMGRFIVEGRGNLLVLLSRSAYQPESILLSPRTYASIETELKALKPRCPVYVADRPVFDRLVGFPIHRGCLAACVRENAEDPLELARRALEEEATPRLVVLEGLANLDNVGLIFRNAMAFGARAILLCSKTCDPLYRKAIRTSMGGSLCVPFARAKSFPEMLAGLQTLGYEVLAFHPSPQSLPIETLRSVRLGPTALLFGTEGSGLTESALASASRHVRIEMEAGVDSLNVGVAAGIGLSLLRCVDATSTELGVDGRKMGAMGIGE
jgi:tRNA G18 (ribose-2'-O)-methylase SpoU